MLNRTELEVLERFLNAPKGTDEEFWALDEIIQMVDSKRHQYDRVDGIQERGLHAEG